ncbi:unnamed protein product [Xylocopa violacea]|uniref:H15 domain-containing protein n=1 Tax=Xylocopa violacea TaxID=135666 RepID=A0ABP1NIZ7_XYLVO
MVRKSSLVYDLLRTEQPQEGFSEKEIVEQISNKHDIVAGKALRKQVAVALRRGLDFGIIAKKSNRYKFDPDGGKINTFRRRASSRKNRTRRKNERKSTKTRQRSNKTGNKNRKQSRSIPQPKLPKTWAPSRRNLTEEPVSKVKKV